MAAVSEWRRQHPLQSLALRAGLKKSPTDLQRLEQTHGESVRFPQGSQRRLNEIDQDWPKKSLAYQQQLEREGDEIIKAKRYVGVIDAHPDHFCRVWQREDQELMQTQKRDERRSRDSRSGWRPESVKPFFNDDEFFPTAWAAHSRLRDWGG